MTKKGTIAVRLGGGIGDHILAMRMLYFIRKRFPSYKMTGYSDAGGALPQLEVTRMSPYFSEVIPIYYKKGFPKVSTWGTLGNMEKKYINEMWSHEFFFGSCEHDFYMWESIILGVPFLEILAHRPELVIRQDFEREADKILGAYRGFRLVGLDISKHDFWYLEENKGIIHKFICRLLRNPKVIILNFYVSDYKFPIWPKVWSDHKERKVRRESLKTGELWNIDKRVIPMVDLPITTVAALLKRCRYFIGVDNGVKHMAWALGIPHTLFHYDKSNEQTIVQWMPDIDRMLLFDCSHKDFSRHCFEAEHYL